MTSLAHRLLLALLIFCVLSTVSQARPPSDLSLLHDILEDTQKQLDQELKALDYVLEHLLRNRRQTTEGMSPAELRNLKRTRCFFNPISC
ncbi:hypothetical protein QR680_013234 [Steinernema hermaphroditum]|uniref:Allatostatin C n=1 Tax=Steinernema hermaphroditum TaxID=289476 RepID=A0AA39I4T2_9BILA|nr:hypothetical protein QR680_013234 [Steinernema hermaphroditum]